MSTHGNLMLDAESLYTELLKGVRSMLTANTRLVGITSGGAWLAARLQKDLKLEGEAGSISSAMHRDDFAQRGLADAIREVQSSLRGAVERSAGPEAAAELQAANTAWANFVRIQDAASRIGAKDGIFTPAQLTAAVRAKDGSGRKAAFARGDALMQDLARRPPPASQA